MGICIYIYIRKTITVTIHLSLVCRSWSPAVPVLSGLEFTTDGDYYLPLLPSGNQTWLAVKSWKLVNSSFTLIFPAIETSSYRNILKPLWIIASSGISHGCPAMTGAWPVWCSRGPDIVDGLREVHDKIKDVREAEWTGHLPWKNWENVYCLKRLEKAWTNRKQKFQTSMETDRDWYKQVQQKVRKSHIGSVHEFQALILHR